MKNETEGRFPLSCFSKNGGAKMDEIGLATITGLFAGVLGTGVGGIIAVLMRRPGKSLLSFILGFAGGIMISIVCFDLIPEAFAVGGLVYGIMGLILGTFLIAGLDLIIPHFHFFSYDSKGANAHFIRMGILIGLGIALHNIPEGLAIGAGYASKAKLGFGIASIMALQNLPEGIAMAAPLMMGITNKWTVVLYCVLVGVPMGIGTFVGAYIGAISPIYLSLSLGFAGGAMLFITCDQLIPEAHELKKGHTATFGIVIGVIVGIILSSVFKI